MSATKWSHNQSYSLRGLLQAVAAATEFIVRTGGTYRDIERVTLSPNNVWEASIKYTEAPPQCPHLGCEGREPLVIDAEAETTPTEFDIGTYLERQGYHVVGDWDGGDTIVDCTCGRRYLYSKRSPRCPVCVRQFPEQLLEIVRAAHGKLDI